MFVRKSTNTKLTDDQVREIKYDVDRELVTAKSVADEYGVSDKQIRRIWNGEQWRDI